MIRAALVALLVVGPGCRYDRDGDGFVGRDDCDDTDPLAFPGAPERCNGVDDDCDHAVDEVTDVPLRYADADGDGHGDPERPLAGCPDDRGAPRADDCDDTDPTRSPSAPEQCNGIDDDCDGVADEAPEPMRYADRDGDGVGAEPIGCAWFAVDVPGDCDDDDPTRFPGSPEACDGIDNDCDGIVEGEDDADADGVRACDGDCDDLDPTRAPGRTERCNGVDDDCDGSIDGSDTWFDLRWPVRLPVQVTAPAPTDRPILLDLDGIEAFDTLGLEPAFDPETVRVMAQACDGTGLVELPSRFLDAQVGLDRAGDPTDALGDGVGALVVLHDLDGDLATVEPYEGVLDLAIYLGGPEPSPAWPSDLEVDGTTLTAGGAESSFVPSHGGLVELVVDDVLVASQAGASSGNGLRTAAGSLSAALFPATPLAADADALTASVASVTTLENAAGAVSSGYGYRRFAGRPELWVRQRLITVAPTTIAGPVDRTAAVRPWQAAHDALAPVEHSVAPDRRWGQVQGDDGGMAWVWVAPPRYLTHVEDDGREAWLAANDVSDCCEGTTGQLPSGTAVVDGAVLLLRPHLGPFDAEGWAEATLGVEVTVGAPEGL